MMTGTLWGHLYHCKTNSHNIVSAECLTTKLFHTKNCLKLLSSQTFSWKQSWRYFKVFAAESVERLDKLSQGHKSLKDCFQLELQVCDYLSQSKTSGGGIKYKKLWEGELTSFLCFHLNTIVTLFLFSRASALIIDFGLLKEPYPTSSASCSHLNLSVLL